MRECSRGHWPFYRHRWEKRLFDKFGTGKRDQPWYLCRLCSKARFT